MNKTRLFGQDQNASSKTRPVLSRIVGRIFLRVDRTDDWSFASFPRRHGDRRRAFLVHRDSALAWFTLKPAISALYRTRWGCAVGVCPASPGSRRSESLVARRRGCGKPQLGGGDDPLLSTPGYGLGRFIGASARFHLDEDQRPAAARDDVDFAERCFEAARENAIALGVLLRFRYEPFSARHLRELNQWQKIRLFRVMPR
jgi:hypothetical protein